MEDENFGKISIMKSGHCQLPGKCLLERASQEFDRVFQRGGQQTAQRRGHSTQGREVHRPVSALQSREGAPRCQKQGTQRLGDCCTSD